MNDSQTFLNPCFRWEPFAPFAGDLEKTARLHDFVLYAYNLLGCVYGERSATNRLWKL
ncbi:MAG: hypothetical protein JWM68_5683 [Verrucomicrobiales bacterium]|nr:hypothetical protein [Verrucomicrobiales bacterium]